MRVQEDPEEDVTFSEEDAEDQDEEADDVEDADDGEGEIDEEDSAEEDEDILDDEDEDEDEDDDDEEASVSNRRSAATTKKARVRRCKQKQTSRKLWSRQVSDDFFVKVATLHLLTLIIRRVHKYQVSLPASSFLTENFELILTQLIFVY